MKRGLLLINLGTPKSTDVSSVRRYLCEFLTDRRVIDIPALLRYILVYAFILPFRSKRSALAYQSIWTEQGSPLLFHSQNLMLQVQDAVGADSKVALGMRYGSPSIRDALNRLKDCESITILPLYPQYSSAASGSAIAEVFRIINSWDLIPSITIIRDFFQHSAYIKAQTQIIKDHFDGTAHILFSYHGIPERQITKNSCKMICSTPCSTSKEQIQECYRAHCYHTSRLLAKELALSTENYSTAFQSRLGKTPWIQPYTDETIAKLSAEGIKKLIVVCPSFVADCLETLEEIGIKAKQQWLDLGGEELIVIPSMNTNPLWVKAIVEITHMQPDSRIGASCESTINS
ncbi:ferrochelatase [Legionella longbeachae]|uniref:Ferrochelatase n=1 Tax=Legionella longbeachae serogroup 1 (strain NSW150) TaxID=661367 RepID=D3HLB2_LEGLN|nr:ferrochelatase [Legionella longbeachae]VEE03737.1 ferrochelatase [Legionella oakridgensis]HBD7397459.1 ferrochelatase [Legionella pneumophila]ARB93383.1 ferrochelatase [Legionella longbeachae]ARM33511.1 ferrochelatase [Legionella longbeachae]EEZ93634.1 ferrochelatase [Legionella longbeachae D-4968]